MAPHQYISRQPDGVVTERLFGDRIVRFLYSPARERAPWLFRTLISQRVSSLLGLLYFDLPLAPGLARNQRFLKAWGVDPAECLDPPRSFTTARRLFERKIRYETCRPMPPDARTIVSPADARAVVGSLSQDSPLFVKGKFFDLGELLGPGRQRLVERFQNGSFAVFRLTPDKYHYNHAPVSGVVIDQYEVPGEYHSCNPSAVVELVTPFSKNKRAVTIIETDVAWGSRCGVVAMVEIVALMIGGLAQCYSALGYDDPVRVEPGLWLERGQPKSLFRPGSSTVVLLLEPGRAVFSADLAGNVGRAEVRSRYSSAFGRPLVETDVRVRSPIAEAARGGEGWG